MNAEIFRGRHCNSLVEPKRSSFLRLLWEIAIKVRLGKIRADLRELVDQIEASGFQELPVFSRHAIVVADLPMHHNDPFDRLLIAHSLCEPLRLVTADTQLQQYSDLIIEV